MVEFVAADASFEDRGAVQFHVGVAIEISGGSEFDAHYDETVESFLTENDIESPHRIIKTDDMLQRLPSFEIRDAAGDLIEDLLQNPAIKRIYVLYGWYDESVKLPWKQNQMRGIEFSANYLGQVFPVITLWKYYDYFYEEEGESVPDDAWIDNVQGNIIGAWKAVGGEFDVNLVPHGDMTYPSLSTADLLAGHLARTAPKKNLNSLHKSGYGFLNNITPKSVNLEAQFVNEEQEPMIVPDYPYSIQEELHWPHPILFIHDEVFGDYEYALPRTDFHGFARKWAFEHRGSLVKLNPNKMPSIVKDGDYIVYTDASNKEIPQMIQDLNPTKNTTLLSSSQFLQTLD